MSVWPPAAIIRRVHVIRESSMGDVLLCEPVVAALAARYPSATLTVITRPAYHPLFEAHPDVSRVCAPSMVDAVPDLAVDLQNRMRTRWLARTAPWHRHWRKRRGWAGWRSLLGGPMHRDYRGGPHQTQRMAIDLGLDADRRPKMFLKSAWLSAVQPLVPAVPFAVLVPCAGQATKTWPAARFAEVGAALAADGLQIRVLGGPGERTILESIARHVGTALPDTLCLGQAAAVLSRAAVVIAGDTGFAHVAAAVGTPVVAVFGPTPPGRWGPAAHQGQSVSRDLQCAPCSDYGSKPCRFGHRECLTALPSDPIVAAARMQVRRDQRTPR